MNFSTILAKIDSKMKRRCKKKSTSNIHVKNEKSTTNQAKKAANFEIKIENLEKDAQAIKLPELKELDSLKTEDTNSNRNEQESNRAQTTSTEIAELVTPGNVDNKFLFIELKLISIDSKCVDYEKLEQRFLCVDAKALIEQVKKFILKKMNINEDSFEVILSKFL